MPLIKSTLLVLFFVKCTSSVFACGNEYYRTSNPFNNNKLILSHLLHGAEGALPYWINGFADDVSEERSVIIEKMEAKGFKPVDTWEITWPEIQIALQKNIDFKLLSDFAWHELRLGNKQNAVKLLEALYAKYPNEYNVLANLGTAYEVTGDNQKALKLLQKAVAINPQSHFGSEWIHIKILEQKVKAKPDYRLILNLKADENPSGWLKGEVYDKAIKPDSLMVQLAYQLHERTSFVAPQDPIVGQLVKDFADLVALTHSQKEAKDFYDYALRYDSTVLKTKPPVVEEKTITANNTIKIGKSTGLYIGAAVVGLIAIILIVIRGRNKTSH